MTVGEVFSDAWRLYRALFRRAVVVAGLVFAVVGFANALAGRSDNRWAALVSLALSLVGGLLVQGALVEIVHDLHESRPVRRVGEYYDATRDRLGTLLGASILYGIGVAVGFLLLVVPGLIAIARWSLIVPLVMIERLGWREAFVRSSELVRGRTGRVLVVIVVSNLLTSLGTLAVSSAFSFLPSFGAAWVGATVAGAVIVPFEALVLTVLYYRLRQPARPVLPEYAA